MVCGVSFDLPVAFNTAEWPFTSPGFPSSLLTDFSYSFSAWHLSVGVFLLWDSCLRSLLSIVSLGIHSSSNTVNMLMIPKSVSSTNQPLDFWIHVFNCLLNISSWIYNRYLKLNMLKLFLILAILALTAQSFPPLFLFPKRDD